MFSRPLTVMAISDLDVKRAASDASVKSIVDTHVHVTCVCEVEVEVLSTS